GQRGQPIAGARARNPARPCAAQATLAQARQAPARDRESRDPDGGLFSRVHPDRRYHPAVRQGSALPEARSRGGILLDRTHQRSDAGIPEGSVLMAIESSTALRDVAPSLAATSLAEPGDDRLNAEMKLLACLDLLRCPIDAVPLTWNPSTTRLEGKGGCHVFPVRSGIPRLFAPNEWPANRSDVTDIVQQFYEQTPFPNYDGLDSRDSLRRKARDGVLARLLDEQISHTASILEVGCGTGQLTNFLG